MVSTAAPAATSLIIKPRAPKQTMRKGGVICDHLEYLGEIFGSTSPFSVGQSFSINPALPVFPWLCPVASAYELYKFRSLRFIYAGRSSSAIGGYCTLAIDYDPTDPAPASKTEVNNFNDRTAVVPWETRADLVCGKDALTRLSKFMTRKSSIADDLGLYDLGTLYVVSGNQTSNIAIGELWVEYVLELWQPQTERAGPLLPRNNAVFNQTAAAPYTTGTLLVPFSNVVYNPFGFTDTAGAISGVAGVFNVYAQIQYSAATAPTAMSLNIFRNNVSVQNVTLPGSTAGTANLQAVVSLTATDIVTVGVFFTGGATIQLLPGTPAGTANILQFTPA